MLKKIEKNYFKLYLTFTDSISLFKNKLLRFNVDCFKNLLCILSAILKAERKNKFFIILLMILMLNSCRFPDNFGFFQPITMNMKVPDGPPEFKAGWHNGCRSALGMRSFANSYVYQDKGSAEFGNGVYQHDQTYNSAWSNAFFVCATYAGTFVDYNSMRHGPLQ
jgi:hypothetical protein